MELFIRKNNTWEQRKLGEYSVIITGGTPSTRILEYWSPKEIPWMSSGEINKKRISKTEDRISKLGLEQSSARWVKKNSILIALAGQGKTRGTVAINEVELTTNQSIAAIELDNSLNTEFVFQNLDSRYDELRKESSGDGTRGGLNKKIISDLYIPYTEYKEQDVIGHFFKKLDNLITLHQRKLNKLEKLKKAYLEELFPAGNQCKPKRRFKEFKDDWEQRKLGEVVEQTGTGKSKFVSKKVGRYEILGSTSIIGFDDSYDYEGEFILTARVGANAGQLYRHSGKVKISDNTVFIKDKNVDFLYYLLLKYDLTRLSFGTGQPLVKSSELQKLAINIPLEINEIQKIGILFGQIDNLITLHQRKLQKLKKLKAAYLEELFV